MLFYGEEALAACEGNGKGIRLLVTDVIMPKMSGGELAEKLAARNKALRVRFISGYTGNVIERQGILPKGTNFLQKPFTSADLGEKIRGILAYARTDRYERPSASPPP